LVVPLTSRPILAAVRPTAGRIEAANGEAPR
jgi:hypothetical protein